MAKVAELIYDVRDAVKEFTDDSELDDRYVIYLYNIKRAKYLRQDLNNYLKTTDNSIKQTLCLALEEVSADECNVSYDCGTILRTVKPIPTPLELHTKVAITNVKPTTRISVPFNFISKERAPYVADAPFKNSIYAFLDTDNHIYVFSKNDSYKLLECLTVTGVFEDPLLLQDYLDCCSCNDAKVCFDIDTTEYPLQPHFIDLIREEIIRDLLRTKQIPEDKANDSTD